MKYNNDTPLAQDEYYKMVDEHLDMLRSAYGKEQEHMVEEARVKITEWVSEMKRDKSMAPVFRAKMKESEEALRLFRSYVDRRIKTAISMNMGSEYTKSFIRSLKEDEEVLKNSVKKWEHLLMMSLGKSNGNKDIDFDELKQSVRIETLVDVPMKSRGRSQICCPIHNEDTPSFVVYHDNNSFYCFGCQAGGSVIDLIMKRDGVSIKEAVNLLTGMQ